MPPSELFRSALRAALIRLYDPNHLRQSPLVGLFALDQQANVALALQRTLIDGIATLEPGADIPSHAKAWRTYELLFCRYVQQLTAQQVAEQMSLSERQVRRTQHEALDALAGSLWERFKLDRRPPVDAGATESVGADASSMLNQELAWVTEMPLAEPVDLIAALSAAVELAQPLALQYGVQIDTLVRAEPAELAVHPVALNQMLLSLVRLAIAWAPKGRVLAAVRHERLPSVTVQATSDETSDPSLSDNDRTSLNMVRQLAERSGGRLAYQIDGAVFTALLELPPSERVTVMAIDDNEDVLRLYQRYCAGTRFHLVGLSNVDDMPSMIERFTPDIVLLDVMMPNLDGWSLLGRLRLHPQIGGLPIIVSTILSEEGLALSLGADGFLRKPVDQQALLSTLNRHAVAGLAGRSGREPESR